MRWSGVSLIIKAIDPKPLRLFASRWEIAKKFSCVSRSVKIIKNPKGNTSSMLDAEEVNPNGYYGISPNKNTV